MGAGWAERFKSEHHNATIDLKSDSRGTVFFVRFPCLAVNLIVPLPNSQKAGGPIDFLSYLAQVEGRVSPFARNE